jgi:16S rRNA (cytosine967-C5)-methyltransferase
MMRKGFVNYNSFLADMTKFEAIRRLPLFDAVLADVPCSGSGTWSRTPEWLSYFSEDMLQRYVKNQKIIIGNAVKKLKTGGKLIYITCSVYADENEQNINWFLQNLPLKPDTQCYFQFSKAGGDTLFAARMIKTNE